MCTFNDNRPECSLGSRRCTISAESQLNIISRLVIYGEALRCHWKSTLYLYKNHVQSSFSSSSSSSLSSPSYHALIHIGKLYTTAAQNAPHRIPPPLGLPTIKILSHLIYSQLEHVIRSIIIFYTPHPWVDSKGWKGSPSTREQLCQYWAYQDLPKMLKNSPPIGSAWTPSFHFEGNFLNSGKSWSFLGSFREMK